MKCPVCPESTLLMSERQGVEIDYCPNCRGVWLDRGELDKLIERSARQPAPAPAAPPSFLVQPPAAQHSSYGQGHHKHHRKKSFLSEVFDFD